MSNHTFASRSVVAVIVALLAAIPSLRAQTGSDSERIEKEAFRRGDRNGFLRAFGRLAVPCYVCKQPVVVNVAEPEIKKLILGNLVGRFRHRGCQEHTRRWA